MKTRAMISILLGVGATIGVLLGCGAAPASQGPQEVPATKVSEIAVADQPLEPAPPAKMFQADSLPPKAVAAVKSEPESAPVEVGYKVGMHAPEFGMSLLDGSRVTSARLADEGKPVFIYFHATW